MNALLSTLLLTDFGHRMASGGTRGGIFTRDSPTGFQVEQGPPLLPEAPKGGPKVRHGEPSTPPSLDGADRLGHHLSPDMFISNQSYLPVWCYLCDRTRAHEVSFDGPTLVRRCLTCTVLTRRAIVNRTRKDEL